MVYKLLHFNIRVLSLDPNVYWVPAMRLSSLAKMKMRRKWIMALFFSTRWAIIKESVEDFHLGNQWTHISIKTDPYITQGGNMYFNPWWLLRCVDFIFWFKLFFLFLILSWGFILLRITTLWCFALETTTKSRGFRTFNWMFNSMY